MLRVGLEDQLRGAFQRRPQGPLLHRCFFPRILTIFILFHQRTKTNIYGDGKDEIHTEGINV